MLVDHIIGKPETQGLKRLIVYTLLDYRHQFIRSLYIMDSKHELKYQ